jgi:hypothetical protein
MYSPQEAADIAFRDVQEVARKRVDVLLDMVDNIHVTESRGTRSRIRLEVPYSARGEGWIEFVESSCSRGAASFDQDYINALRDTGWVVLHFPEALINERFAYDKALDVEERARRAGAPRPEVWVYLYDRRGQERRVV